jgi:DNA-directed RNA polymerase specialized sigma24 family protein
MEVPVNRILKGRTLDVLDYIEKNAPPDHKEKYRYGDMYTFRDHAIVRKAIQLMEDDDECWVIISAFWNDLSFRKISETMEIPETEVLRIYDRALRRIRDFCLSEKSFSIALPTEIPRAA